MGSNVSAEIIYEISQVELNLEQVTTKLHFSCHRDTRSP